MVVEKSTAVHHSLGEITPVTGGGNRGDGCGDRIGGGSGDGRGRAIEVA